MKEKRERGQMWKTTERGREEEKEVRVSLSVLVLQPV